MRLAIFGIPRVVSEVVHRMCKYRYIGTVQCRQGDADGIAPVAYSALTGNPFGLGLKRSCYSLSNR